MKSKLAIALATSVASMTMQAADAADSVKTESMNADLTKAEPIRNVVLVHGAFADGSGWSAVAKLLSAKGYQVSIVQVPETSFADDVKATQRVIDMQAGRVVLVGHSYGGAIITEAGNDAKVASLVYVAALAPETGEAAGALLQKTPAAGHSIKATADGFLYIDPDSFAADFAADVPKSETSFMARSQVFVASSAFGQPISQAAWKTKPSWAVVATEDRSINPELERWMYARSASHVTELKSSHAAYISHPEDVAKVIEAASKAPAK